jgi:glycosyltransferase involved in cell wall biosynthesis
VKILFLNPAPALGGAERSLLDLMASLRRAAPSIELHLATPEPGPLTAQAERLGVAVSLLPMPAAVRRMGDSALRGRGRGRAALALLVPGIPAAWAGWGYGHRLRRLVEEVRPDVVHSNGIKCHLLTRLARLRDTAVVWHVHDFLGGRPLMARGLRWAAGAASGAVAVSRAVAEDARGVLGSVPVAVVANGIDTERFAPDPGDGARLDRLAGPLAVGPEDVRVGLVGTFARWRGQDVFLRAAERVGALVPGRAVRFYVVGGPIYQTRGSPRSEDELRRQGAGLLAAGRLGFVGFQEESAAVYRSLDVVMQASTQPEPFGLTIAEALACGSAVLVARAGGAAELFTPDHEAVGVPPGDADALARAIAELVADADRRRRPGKQARATAVERFRRERLGPEVLAAYRRFGVGAPVASGSAREPVCARPRNIIDFQ